MMYFLICLLTVGAEVSATTPRKPPPGCPFPSEPICPIGEKFNECYAHCQDTCENYNKPSRPCTHQCQSGCVCAAGTVRRKDGQCVPPSQCSQDLTFSTAGTSCSVDEVFDPCSAHCEPTCEHHELNRPCTAICKPGCRCRDGLVRHKNGRCVQLEECTPRPCGLNEHYEKDSHRCQLSCLDYHLEPILGPCEAASGCYCDLNLVRDVDGKCIKREDCLSNQTCSDPNAERVVCGLASECRPTCAVPNPGRCTSQLCVRNDCVCKPGFVLSEQGGECVAPNHCLIQKSCNGDPNAHIKECPLACPATCAAPNAGPCPRPCEPVGCECKDGYILSEDNGRCILPDNCKGGNPCGGNQTFVSCNVPCPSDYCPVTSSPNTFVCETPMPCYPGCRCQFNYLLRSVGDQRCIYASDCPPQKCDINEVWSGCPSQCLAEDCANVGDAPTPCNNAPWCRPRCICKDGYFRDNTPERKCIPANQCPPRPCGLNEHYEKDSHRCQLSCLDYHLEPILGPCEAASGCYCDLNLVRDVDGKCIKREDCLSNQTCSDPNAERVVCGLASECRPTCAVPNPGRCTSQLCVRNDCVCKPGFVLSEQGGECVAPNHCLIQKSCNGDPNAHIKECPLACPATCAAPNAGPCPRPCEPVGCECKDGYILSEDNGRCILPDNCKGGNPCGGNQTFVSCNVPCPSDYCPVTSSPNTVVCETPMPCYPGCRCQFNFLLRSVGDQRCIYASDCPPLKCDINEVWSGCPSHCLAEDCTNVGDAPTPCNNAPWCRPRCICKDGYFRDNTPERKCIPANQCPPRPCGLNEHYEKDSHRCQLSCLDYHLEPILGPCEAASGCYCDLNLVKDVDGKCIKREDCLSNQTCSDPNAERVVCGLASECRPTCAVPNPGRCTSQLCVRNDCVCKPGFVLSEQGGECVAPNHCLIQKSCNGDPNAHIKECPLACPATCAAPNAGPCPRPCEPVGCECKDGYILSEDNGRCILPDNCKAKCGLNEHYERDRSKCELTCENYELEPILGPCVAISGCFCNQGFVRNKQWQCVPKYQCPKRIICPRNEILSDCYNTCHMTCKTRLRSDGRVCHQACVESGCLCVDGYLRHDNGTCVPVSQCSPPACWASETYSACGPACPATCRNRGDTCQVCTAQCVEDCFCNQGLVRADDGTCVAPKDCPPRTCSDRNEEFVECPPTCPPTDNCYELGTKYDCSKFPKCCKPQCRCKSGYGRSKKGVCVTTEQCIHGE